MDEALHLDDVLIAAQGACESCRAFALIPARLYIFVNGCDLLWLLKVYSAYGHLVKQARELLRDTSPGACPVRHRQCDRLLDVGALHLEPILPRGQGAGCACHYNIAAMTFCMQFTCNKVRHDLAKIRRDAHGG